MPRIGSLTAFTSTANSGSTTVTVGTGAKLFLVAVSGYEAVANFFSGGTLTLNGTARTGVVGADASTSFFMGALFYWITPPVGDFTLAWDWSGAGAPDNGVRFAYGSYDDDVDTVTPVRDSFGGQNAAGPHATDTLTAASGDLIIAWGEAFFSTAPTAWVWTNATEILETDDAISAGGSWAERSPTGNVVITAEEEENSDGGIMAIVFQMAGGVAAPKRLLTLGVGSLYPLCPLYPAWWRWRRTGHRRGRRTR